MCVDVTMIVLQAFHTKSVKKCEMMIQKKIMVVIEWNISDLYSLDIAYGEHIILH